MLVFIVIVRYCEGWNHPLEWKVTPSTPVSNIGAFSATPDKRVKREPLVHSETITLTFPQFASPSPNSGGQIYPKVACGGYA